MCREMSCGDPVEDSASFGEAGHQRGYGVTCSGRETSVTQCALREYMKSNNDRTGEAAVKCTGKTPSTEYTVEVIVYSLVKF